MSKSLRSADWFGKSDKMGFVHRSWLRNQGYPDDYFQGKPVIGICNTWSDLTPCNGHLRDFAEVVKRGVIEAGGFPLEFPVTSLGETLMRPTTMLFRNLASMDTEETIRANPIDCIINGLRQNHACYTDGCLQCGPADHRSSWRTDAKWKIQR